MANQVGGMVWVLDTPGATPIFRTRVWIQEVYWKNPGNINDVFTLTDINGNLIVDGRCEVAGQSQVWKPVADFNGLILSALVSGTVEITIR